MITSPIDYDEEHFTQVEDMPMSLIQELEHYFRIDTSGIQRCLEEGYSVGQIKELCRSMHGTPTIH